MDIAVLHRLIEAIYTDGRIRQLLTKLKPSDLQEDLLHHFIDRLYQYNDKHPEKLFMLASHDRTFCKIIGKVEEKEQQLFAWVVGNLKMELMSPSSPFFRKYRKRYEELPAWITTIADNRTETATPADKYSRLVQMGGNGFASAVWAEIEKQEEQRIINFDKKKAAKVLQPVLF